jgi:hypothetical protein
VPTWSFLQMGEEAQFQGNLGYDDDPSRAYAWDSTVANHRRPAVGDIAVVRDSDAAVGIGRINEITQTPQIPKVRRRCPNCGSTGFKRRATRELPYRCGACAEEFATPREEELLVTRYVARYAGDWWPLDETVTASDLRPAYMSRADQHSIRELDEERLCGVLTRGGWDAQPWRIVGRRSHEVPGGWRSGTGRWRRGQAEYRRDLLRRDGAVCAISGPQPPRALDAAHWVPFRSTGRHRLDLGMLLRRDLHALLDSYDISIDVVAWSVRVNPALDRYPDIARYDGAPVLVAQSALAGAVIAEHYKVAMALWDDSDGNARQPS